MCRVWVAYPGGNITLQSWTLRPSSSAKPQPSYIPEALRKDYEEACSIRDLSPKAAATLARRCLQGMIRDFFKIKGESLKQEIDALQARVPREVWDAIDAVRKIGNIGAHMEKNVDVIVDVEPRRGAAFDFADRAALW
jgi:Domain of unknown function (DUF4145)